MPLPLMQEKVFDLDIGIVCNYINLITKQLFCNKFPQLSYNI